MTSREIILNKLRNSTKQAFPSTQEASASYVPVTQMGQESLISRFTAELERLTGKVYVVDDAQAAAETVIRIVGEDTSVLGWEALPVHALYEAFSSKGITVIVPEVRGDDRARVLNELGKVRVGITGADAAFATTGTLAVVAQPGQARLPSLLPSVHVALLSRDHLYPTMESWLNEAGSHALRNSRSVTFITGPSRTSDIEMQTILGVHGPREIHVVIF